MPPVQIVPGAKFHPGPGLQVAAYPDDGLLEEHGAFDERAGEALPLDKVKKARGPELDKMLERNVKKDISRGSQTAGLEDRQEPLGGWLEASTRRPTWGRKPLRSTGSECEPRARGFFWSTTLEGSQDGVSTRGNQETRCSRE